MVDEQLSGQRGSGCDRTPAPGEKAQAESKTVKAVACKKKEGRGIGARVAIQPEEKSSTRQNAKAEQKWRASTSEAEKDESVTEKVCSNRRRADGDAGGEAAGGVEL